MNANKEITEMIKIVCNSCTVCIMEKGLKCSFCLNATEALYHAGYRKQEVKMNGNKICDIDPEYEKNCTNCLHLYNDLPEPPCNTCSHGSAWENV